MKDLAYMHTLINASFGFTSDSMPDPFSINGMQWVAPALDLLEDQMYSSVRDGILIGSGD